MGINQVLHLPNNTKMNTVTTLKSTQSLHSSTHLTMPEINHKSLRCKRPPRRVNDSSALRVMQIIIQLPFRDLDVSSWLRSSLRTVIFDVVTGSSSLNKGFRTSSFSAC